MLFTTSALVNIRHFETDANRSRSTRAQKMPINVQKTPQAEFAAPKFPIDIASATLRDARCARERYLARRFALPAAVAAVVALHAFANGKA
jgi:hypothetical protein